MAGNEQHHILHETMGEPGTPELDNRYRTILDTTIADTLSQALRLIAAEPSLALAGIRVLSYQKKAAALREKNLGEDLLVPAAIFLSITSRCTLSCRGCYHHAGHARPEGEMDAATLDRIVSEAAGLGVSVIVISGGEPFMRRDEIFALAAKFPEILFPVFSNGLAIDEGLACECAKQKNIVPVISVEGFREETDKRRGTGVYDRVMDACARLHDYHVFFGCSVTVTSHNLDVVVSDRFVREMTRTGARAFVYVEYVPVEPGTDNLVLSPARQKDLHAAIARLNTRHPALFFGFPGDEAMYGGCLAAGRGFVHINPTGDLEACPAAPFSDTNLTRVPLSEALKSPLLRELRSYHGLLTESAGGCALWKNREWVKDTLMKGTD